MVLPLMCAFQSPTGFRRRNCMQGFGMDLDRRFQKAPWSRVLVMLLFF